MTGVFSDLGRKARQAHTDRELGFLLVNETLALVPYRQAALWLVEQGVWALSGVLQVDANVPYTHWLDAVAKHLEQQPPSSESRILTARDLPAELATQWGQWWPTHALLLKSDSPGVAGLAFFVREELWTPDEVGELQEWAEVWWHAFAALHQPRGIRIRRWRDRIQQALAWQHGKSWWRQRRIQIMACVLALLVWPVHLTVLAPGELVPAHPMVIRAPLDGVIDLFHVQPNQVVKADQPLFSFDEIVIQSRLEVALQSLATAETDYRQTMQLAMADAKSRTQLGLLLGKVEERRAEVDYLQEQLSRARVLAPKDGVVLMDDPSEWIGKPVTTGERILRLAALDDVEVEAWLPLADAINLLPGDAVTLYLSVSPLSPVSARLRYMAHDAVQRPDGSFAYRVRATIEGQVKQRVGLKGTAKLQGAWVPFSYWVLRRPLATARAYLGW